VSVKERVAGSFYRALVCVFAATSKSTRQWTRSEATVVVSQRASNCP